jgi:hypothetical protein
MRWSRKKMVRRRGRAGNILRKMSLRWLFLGWMRVKEKMRNSLNKELVHKLRTKNLKLKRSH